MIPKIICDVRYNYNTEQLKVLTKNACWVIFMRYYGHRF